MKRLALLFATLAAAAFTLACSSDSAPETPSVTPSASQPAAAATTAPPTAVQPTASPTTAVQPTQPPAVATQPPAPQPTSPPAPQPTSPPAPQPTSPPAPSGPVTIAVSARNLAFDRVSISVTANTSVTVNFTNNDLLVAHDFGVSIPFVPHTETCNGPCQASITFNSGPRGAYSFQCSTHAEMVGTFTVN